MASLHTPAFQLHAYPRLPKLAALQQLRCLLDTCGAHLLESRLCPARPMPMATSGAPSS